MTTMTAPPSSKAAIVDVPFAHREIVARLSPGGRYIDAQSDVDSPWVPFGDKAAIKHLAFDVRQGIFSNILWIKEPGVIGTQQHRGTVWAIGLEGSFRYLEYDWVCKPGEFITETPGTAHTLVTDDPNGMKALFHMQGANEFFDENGNHVETLDVWWFINHYETYCREHGVPINPALYL